jgi:hypothetical protein
VSKSLNTAEFLQLSILNFVSYLIKLMKRIFTAFLTLAFYSSLNAQFHNIWYFGYGAGIDFNSNPPTALNNGQTNLLDYVSSICDKNGNLLFYTDGMSVWNKNHQVMPNGNGLIGNTTAGQCGLIIPIPCNPVKYVIFHLTDFANPGYLNYTVVDMSLSGGLGDVVTTQKNVSLGSGWTEKMCAYYNVAGNNYWVLVHKWNSNEFVAFNVGANAIATQTVSSFVGTSNNSGSYYAPHDAMGQITISKDGTRVLNAVTNQDIIDVFDFNAVTGVVSNPISFSTPAGEKVFGAAFSPDGTKLYSDGLLGTKLYQYDVSSNNPSTIQASQIIIGTVTSNNSNYLYIERGPDDKLYVAHFSASSIGVINNPNALGAACNFSPAGITFSSATSQGGLSRIAYNIPHDADVSVSSSSGTTAICTGQTVTLTATGANTYTWSNSSQGNIITINPTATTVYTVTGNGTSACLSTTQITIAVNVGSSVTATASSSTICSGKTVTLTASGATTYTWSNNFQGNSITVSPLITTVYTVAGTSSCLSTSQITVNVVNVSLSITASAGTICAGNTVILTASGATTYTWSNNTQGNNITISPLSTTIYSVNATGSSSCTATKNITVTVSKCVGEIENQQQEALFNAYPNPVNDILELNFKNLNQNAIEIKIVDLTGSSVYHASLNSNKLNETQSISTKSWQDGIYFIIVQTPAQQKVIKITKIGS